MGKKLGVTLVFLLVFSMAGVLAVKPTFEIDKGNSGAIWTTTNQCGEEQQDVNEYDYGEKVFINGENFDQGLYGWTIRGQPGGASCDPNEDVAAGTYSVNSSGAFCFEAYTVLNDDCGVYKATFGKNKVDNYHVVPEFGFYATILTVLSALGIFFVVRRN